MDIRSYFTAKKPQKPKIEDDDDIIPESPEVQIKSKKKKSSHESHKLQKGKKFNLDNVKKLKEVAPCDMFGNGPIKRSEPIVKKEKKKTETGIHSDDEFEKSLLEIDCIDEIKPELVEQKHNSIEHLVDKTKSKSVNKSPNKPKNGSEPSSSKEYTKPKYVDKESKKEMEKHKAEIKKSLSNKRKFDEFIESDNKYTDKKKKTNSDIDYKNNTSNGNIALKLENHDADMNLSINEYKHEKHDVEEPKNKKKRLSLNESVLTDEERHERKMHSAALYQKYLNRSGPKHLGTKEIPEGSPNCLKDCAFLLTGVLESFERDEIVEAINKYGGCVKNSISKKVTHVLAGEDAGPAKMAKAQDLGIKIINEDEFLTIIKDSHKRNDKSERNGIKKEKDHSNLSRSKKNSKEHLSVNATDHKDVKDKKSHKDTKSEHKSPKHTDLKIKSSDNNIKREKSKTPPKIKDDIKIQTNINAELEPKPSINGSKNDTDNEYSMWVEKYKPQSVKYIIGQTGESSNVNKLINWLTKWYVNRKAKIPKPSPWAKKDDGGYYKAALLSGPPGVGKTTTVSLVCKQLGFDMVEFNASDTRNKTLIKEQIGELLTTTSLSAYAKGDTGKQAVTKKHVLVMDEVDGMAGNEDRGGLQELIGLIKSTSVPIICMCNDRNSQKMRSLVNYCYDLRFNRPRVDQIKAGMMSVCFKEGLKIPGDVVSQLIVSANQDVRQTLNLLSMWAADPTLLDTDRLKKDASTVKKDVKLGPWEAIRKVFTAEEHKNMTIHDRSDLFFYDYSLAPLFVQENYLQVAPHCPKNEVLQRISKAADSISIGDLVDSRIRGSQAWGLLPMQAMYSSVIPGHAMSGHVTGQIQFPGWLGKNSRANKMHRLCQEIHSHTRLSTSGSKSSIFLDYCTHLRNAIVDPLIKEKSDGIAKSLDILESYHLMREDLDSLTELSLWPGQRNPTILIDPKVKAAMTRLYNKQASALPYAAGGVRRARPRDDPLDSQDTPPSDEYDPTDPPTDDETHDSDPENDALIKKKKSKEVEKPSSSNKKPSSSKAKATNGGKTKKK